MKAYGVLMVFAMLVALYSTVKLIKWSNGSPGKLAISVLPLSAMMMLFFGVELMRVYLVNILQSH